MSYWDRLRTARYRSPSGYEIEFSFRELQRASGHKGGPHEAPQQNDAQVQDLGLTAQHFSVEATIHGQDYDQDADRFYDMLRESGFGTLLHPRWGDIPVLPLTFLQREAFVEGAGAAVFEVDFVRVPDVQFAETTTAAGAAITEGADAAAAATSEQLAVSPTTAAQVAAVTQSFVAQAAQFRGRVTTWLAREGSIATEFEAAYTAFVDTIGTLLLDPVALADAYIALVRIPAQAGISVPTKAQAYADELIALAVNGLTVGASDPEAASRVLQFLATLIGLAESTVEGDLTTRADALLVVDALVGALEDALAAVEADEAATGYVAPAELISRARALIAQAQALMLAQSFGLAVERRLILAEDRTPLDLVHELYSPSSADDLETHLDDFIAHNRLAGDELFLIPRGREVRYYAE